MEYFDNYMINPLVKENTFIHRRPNDVPLPVYEGAREVLPTPFWDHHDDVIECYWKAWELACEHVNPATNENGFVAPYIDSAFNNSLFMWDTCFIMMFAKYGRRAFDFQQSLDNFYAKQHPDGFICREIKESDGTDSFHRHDPSSTGPNGLPFAEWEHYQHTNDKGRLAEVFPVLLAYHRWLKLYRTWPDGSYWSSGWGAGMDNQPRMPEGEGLISDYYHGHLSWIDPTIQQIFSAKLLSAMAEVLGRQADIPDIKQEQDYLTNYVNTRMWDEKTSFYYDLRSNGELSDVKTIGAYWALMSHLVPDVRVEPFVAHLENPDEFKTQHRIPALSKDHPKYMVGTVYWSGGVWAPTNYMVMRGLNEYGYGGLAHEIALNHVLNVTNVYKKTGTIWEYFSPESADPCVAARPDFVGWGGLPAIAVLIEYVFGIVSDPQNHQLVWNVRLLEKHGITQMPFGPDGIVNLTCEARESIEETPRVVIHSDVPMTVRIIWAGGEVVRKVSGSLKLI